MKRLKLFFVCLLMAVLSIGQVWGADATCTLTNANIVAGSGGTSYGDASATDGCGKTWNAYAIKNHHSTVTSSNKFWQIKKYASNTAYYIQVPTMPGKITSIVLTVSNSNQPMTGGGNSSTLYFSASSSTSATGTGVASGTGASSVTIDCSALNLTSGYITASGAVRIWDVEVTYTAGGCSSEVTITKGAENHGTYTLSDTKVCADGDGGEITISNISPANGYEFDEITTSASGTVDNDLKKVTGIKAATTITVKFKEKTKYTVTWNNSGVETTSQVYAGAKPVFPAAPVACDATSTTFIGWATAPWDGKIANLDDKTVYTSADAMPAVSGAVTYYAVFAKVAGESGWVETAIGDLGASDVFVIVGNNGSTYAMTNNNGTSSAPSVSAVTISDGKISGTPAETIKWNISGNATDGYTFYPNGNSESWLYCTSANNGVRVGTNDNKTFTIDEGYLKHSGTSRYVGIYNSQDWRCYTSNGGNIENQTFAFYKYSAGTASDYMTTCAAPTCEDLGTPVVSATEITYNSAKLTWETVANADKYLVKFNGVDQEPTSNTYFNATGLTASTQYTYQVKALAAANQEAYCDGEFSAVANFTTEPAPSATLKLMENGNEVDGGSHTVSVPFALPKEVTHTCGKIFVGWDDDENCDHAPTYAPGASFTFADQTGVTLYAVYADVAPGTTTNIAYTGSTTGNMTGGNDAADLVDATDLTGWSVIGYKGGGSNYPGLNKDGTIRLYYHANGNSYIEVTAPQTIASVTLTMGDLNNVVVKVGENTVAISDGVYPIGASSFAIINGNTTSVQAHIKNIAVNFQGAQSNWATTCVDPLENPTFSLAPVVTPVEDKYEEAINVVITNNAGEGKIYYTTNNQTPTSASTEYTGAITLNTCGTKTIKAIVISDNNQSEVVSATYEMAIPIPSVSAEDPYTEDEAVAVIDGGCYNNEDVWVTGTVASNGAAWYSNSGTYTITLENGFKFYYFYEGENEQAFTENYIAAGDELVAKGKLEKSGNTYRLAQGCYLVSRTPAQKTPIDSDIDNPITVADALGYIDQAATYNLTNVYVKGVASEDPNNQGTFNIHDADVDNTFQIYKGVLSQALIDAGVEVEENDTVIVVGELTKYYSTYEMAEGGEIVVVKKYVAPAANVTGVEVDETATVKVGKTVQLTATVLPVEATNKNVTWSVKGGSEAFAEVSETGLVTGLAEGEAIIIVTTEDGGFTDECTVTVNPIAPANTDIITAEGIGVEGNSYSPWQDKTGFGTASVYAGNSTNGTGTNANAIQLKSKDSNSGIILTGSNGLMLKGLSVTVTSGTNTLNVYAKSTAYVNVSDLYSADEETQGKLIGTVSGTGDLELVDGVLYDDNYQYIGMRSASGALYLEDITITWGDAVTPPEPAYTEVRNELTEGWYYTMCLDKAVTAVKAGSIWKVLSKAANENDVILEEAELPLAAGRPYIFRAAASTLEVAYTGDAVDDPVNDEDNNGLVGSFTGGPIAQSPNNYIIWDNALYYVNSGNVSVGAHRAYLDMTGVPAYNNEPQQGNAPRRRVVMTVHGEQTATGMENVQGDNVQCTKVLIDGQMYILRGEKLYDATGRLVK